MSIYYGWFVEFEFEPIRIPTGKNRTGRRCGKSKAHGTFTKIQHKFCPTCGSPLVDFNEPQYTIKHFAELMRESNVYSRYPHEVIGGPKIAVMINFHETDDYSFSEIKHPEKPDKLEIFAFFESLGYTPASYDVKYGIYQD